MTAPTSTPESLPPFDDYAAKLDRAAAARPRALSDLSQLAADVRISKAALDQAEADEEEAEARHADARRLTVLRRDQYATARRELLAEVERGAEL